MQPGLVGACLFLPAAVIRGQDAYIAESVL